MQLDAEPVTAHCRATHHTVENDDATAERNFDVEQ
jgi:hypothetical protein